jgi:hypothetical protein
MLGVDFNRGQEMVRWPTMLLFASCLMAAGLSTEASQGQDSVGQTTTKEPAAQQAASGQATLKESTPGQAGEAAAAKSGFPLDEFTEFSAVMVGSMQPHDDREGYVYRSGNLLRSEGPMAKGYYITDLTQGMTYAQTKMGCVKDAHAYFRSWPFIASRPGHTSVRVAVGKETLDGRVCQVEDVTVSGKDLPVATKLRFWEPEEWKGFPIRVEDLNSKGSRVVRFKEVVLGPQDPTLFIYPEDCGRLPEGPTKKSAMTPKVKPSAGTPPASSPPQ